LSSEYPAACGGDPLLDAVQLGVVLKEELKEIMKATANNGSGIDLSDIKLPEIMLSVDEN